MSKAVRQVMWWLDPRGLPEAEDRACLEALGLAAVLPGSFEASTAGAPVALVLALEGQGTLAQQLEQYGLGQAASLLPLIVRVPPRNITAAVRVLDEGASHALAYDDFSRASWEDAAARIQAAQAGPAYVFVDPASLRVLELAERVARTEVSVLLEGPTGAGKDVLARVIHEGSARSDKPFVAFNCAALPEHLIEDALFGHEKGAFTGAHKDHPGLFEQAQGGTLFLDEIGDMPLHLQAKLLRVLQERQCVRLGATRAIDLDIRVIAATHRKLTQRIRTGEFREDLFFRLATFRLAVPSLCERPGDIVPLACTFLSQHAPAGTAPILSVEAEQALCAHRWPGNVRELQNVIQRALVLSGGEAVGLEHLMFDYDDGEDAFPAFALPAPGAPLRAPQGEGWNAATAAASPKGCLLDARDSHERSAIEAALRATGSRAEAAERLGISPRTLRYRMARLRERGHAIPRAS
jgi:two-component system response regulator FlrC